MAKTHQLNMERTINAPLSAVWARLIDHEAMPTWAPMTRVTLVEKGTPNINGVGALRAIKLPWAPVVYERVIAFEPERTFTYKITKGFPGLRDHTGIISLEAVDAHTTRWRWDIALEFKALHPIACIAGPLVKRLGITMEGGMDTLKGQMEA